MTAPDPHERDERAEVVERHDGRLGFVRVVNTLISVVTGLFALGLAVHIVLVLGNANMENGFAQFVTSWANAVDLGFDNLFTPANENLRVLLNEGLAAILWLVIGAVLTTLIARIALAGPDRPVWYRRRVVR
ncbi:hypothetical protein SAMN05421810_107284 [Amycolatopsis arida]|uniref:Uncharacterized protein n=1 Tax=Amycolatopsis arida TaxID=587909 RepID=A0A1I5YMX7_9PSEU|nr:hypothetical protein [Amycolatopsis arida]TDX90637.1 hypothetical protein CLV69_107284 [Amycolatopsis arida]SFQ45576.1 hypothetical protein SAMN05421810_107284 [Amycolatopsis arida]